MPLEVHVVLWRLLFVELLVAHVAHGRVEHLDGALPTRFGADALVDASEGAGLDEHYLCNMPGGSDKQQVSSVARELNRQ